MILSMGVSAKLPTRLDKGTPSYDVGSGFDEHLFKTGPAYPKQPPTLSTGSIPFPRLQNSAGLVEPHKEEFSNSSSSQDILASDEAPSEAVRGRIAPGAEQNEIQLSSEKPRLNSPNRGEHIPLLSLQTLQKRPAAAVLNESIVASHSVTNSAAAGKATNAGAPHEKKRAERNAGVTQEKITRDQSESQSLDRNQPTPGAPSLMPISGLEQLRGRHPADVPTHIDTAAHNPPGKPDEVTPINREEVANRSSNAIDDRARTHQRTIPQTEIREAGEKGASKEHGAALESKAHFAMTLNQEGNSIAFSRVTQTQGAVSVKANLAESSAFTKVPGKEGAGFSRVATSQTPNSHQLLEATPKALEVGVATNSHGWLKVRAELASDGRVNALMSSRSVAVQQSLHKELGQLTTFLQSERVPVGSVAVQRDFYGSRSAGLGNASDPKQQSETSPDSQGGSRRAMPHFGRQARGWGEVGNGDVQEVSWPVAYGGMGSWLSVMA